MDYPESFERLIGNSGYDYIGNGNPNAKILIIAKEPAIDMESGKDMYGHDILGNRGLWIKHDDAVEFPYRGQKCHIYMGPDNKTGKVRGEGGTSRTWLAYQSLFDAIVGNCKKKAGDEIDFHKYVFTTDLSSEVAKNSGMTFEERTRQSIKRREKMFKEEFFQKFPIVIVAAGHYPKRYEIDLEELFGVEWIGKTLPVGKKWMNLHYNQQRTKLLIHTNQLSRYTNDLIGAMALHVRNFITDDLHSTVACMKECSC